MTLLLAPIALTGQAAVIVACATGAIGPLPTVLLCSICAYVAFTPVHEAAHHHLGPLNGLVGQLCVVPLLGAFGPYRFLHLQHHAHSDEPARDPDHWSLASSPPLRWLTADVGYLLFYARCWPTRPLAERAELVTRGALYGAAVLAAFAAGPDALRSVVFGWLIPARVALTFLAWSFAWLPHAYLVSGPTGVWRHPLVTVALLGQNHHLAHHRDPRRPFWAIVGGAFTPS